MLKDREIYSDPRERIKAAAVANADVDYTIVLRRMRAVCRVEEIG
jgi:hypothetical protein